MRSPPWTAAGESFLDWIGGRFDPEHFDVIAANDRVPKKRTSRRDP